MSKLFLIIFFAMTTLWATASTAAPYRRLVNFEWDAIEGAQSYDVELKQVKGTGDGKTFTFKVKENVWNGHLTPGNYKMRLRSRDYRNVPGDWSEPSDFNVGLDPASLKYPAAKAQLNSADEQTTSLDLKWEPVGGADSYAVDVVSDDGKTHITETVTEPHLKVTIPVAQNYTWKVTARNAAGLQSETTSVAQFSLVGKALDAPKLQRPESDYVRDIHWTKPENAKNFDIIILRYNDAAKKWEKFQYIENYESETLPFDDKWPGGKYQISVKAKGDGRGTSQIARQAFKVHDGDRSVSAETTALVRKSIDRTNGLFAVASYMVTQMKFSGTNPELVSKVSYSAMGGTARGGIGWLSDRSHWGFLGIVDVSGFTIGGAVKTFDTFELNGIYRGNVGERGEYRIYAGPFYKELPQTNGDPFSGTSTSTKVAAGGAHIGGEYWYALTPKWGLQVNLHLYESLFKFSTPNNQPISNTMSTSMGVMGSYRFNPNMTGLFGVTQREDKISYQAQPSSTNFALPGDVIETTVVGTYLNLTAEWSF
jgi:hypothetical protein